jgi:hypothetical protein
MRGDWNETESKGSVNKDATVYQRLRAVAVGCLKFL